jgi:PAS domain S-box-containing protein
VLVQSPERAQYDGMPQNAVKTGIVDEVLPVEDMPDLLERYFENNFEPFPPSEQIKEKLGGALSDILDIIQNHTGHSFHEYKKNTLYRRILRRLTVHKLKDVNKYLDLLQNDESEQDTLYKELLICVTGFFRDKQVWDYIEDVLLPKIFKERKEELRIWVPGCATGEEAYSYALICLDYIKKHGLNVNLRIFASDIDEDAVQKGRVGAYSDSVVQDIPEELLKRYFVNERGKYRVKKIVRQSVIFAEQNFLQNPPYSNLDIISCRNVLIYMDTSLQEKALTIFHYSLRNNGVLVLGNSESLGKSAKFFKTENRHMKVFRKLSSRVAPNKFWRLTDGFSGSISPTKRNQDSEESSLSELAEKYVLKKHIPPSVIVNDQGEILYVQGRTGDYLEISTGEISTNLTKVAKSGLRLPIATALRKAKKAGKEVFHKDIVLTDEDGEELENAPRVDLSVGPLKNTGVNSDLFVVVMQPSRSNGNTRIQIDNELDGQKALSELERELDEKEEYLQNTIEELESTNEELKSANEEAQSTNEELQSTNEELETSKEELQSINEELTSTNDELNTKINDLDEANSKLQNLLRSTEIATVFLDKGMKIFEFTPAISEIMDLRESDKGRSIKQFTNKLLYDELVDDAKRVLKTLVPEQIEVQSSDDRFYWLRIIPYRTMEDVIQGVVMTFTDFTEKRKQEEELEKHRNHLQELLEEKSTELIRSEKKFRNIVENIPGMVMQYRLNADGTDAVDYASKGVEQIFGVEHEKAVKNISLLWDKVVKEDVDYIRNSLEESKRNNTLLDMEFRLMPEAGKIRWLQVKGKPQKNDNGSVVWDTVQLDITDRKKAVEELQSKDELIRSLTDNIPGYVVRYIYHPDQSEEVVYISKGVEHILGVTVEEAEKDVSLLWGKVLEEDLEALSSAFKIVDSKEGSITADFRVRDQENNIRWLRVFSKYKVIQDGSIIWDNLNLDITENKESELALLREEKKYGELIHSLNEGIWQVDRRGRTVFLNDIMAEMLGYTKEEMLGRDLRDFLNKKAKKEFDKNRKRRAAGVTETYDVDFISKSGDPVHTRISTSGIFDENGDFIGAIAGVIDITKKVITQSELKKSEEQYKTIFDNSLTPILVCDNQGYITSFNRAALGLFEISEDELTGMNLQDFNFQRPLLEKEEDYLFNFKKKEQGEIKFKLENGPTKYAYYHAFRIRTDFNLSVFTDITNLKVTQEALKESERLLNETSKVARTGGWSYNVERDEFSWTKEMYDLYEVSTAFQPTVKKVFEFYHPHYRPIVEDLWNESLRLGKGFNVELKINTSKGNELSVRTIFKPKTDENGRVTYIYGNTQDISDLIKTRKELMRAKQKAEEANKAKSEFLAHMSHEIRTPLNGVIGFADLLRRTSMDSTQQEYVDLVNKSARNLLEIINNILDFSKIEAGKVELEYIETNLYYLLEKTVDIVSYPAGDKGLELILKIGSDLPQVVEIDRVRLKQILANLLSNAVKFTEAGEVILEVTSENVDDSNCEIKFSVKDTGIGISKAAQNKLFKAFSQADSATTRKYGGTGLGLIIANSLAESMGGRIKIDSKEGEGSNFYFTIKVKCVRGESFIPESPKVLKSCLLAEDNEVAGRYMRDLLTEWGLQVKMVDSGKKALAELKKKKVSYDLMILDQNMSDLKGLETIKKIRENKSIDISHCHFMVMNSSMADAGFNEECDELSVHLRVQKPLKPRLFFRMLRKIEEGELDLETENLPVPDNESNSIDDDEEKIILIAEDNKVNMALSKSLLSQMLPKCTLLEAKNGREAVELTKVHKPDMILMDIRMPEMDGLEATSKIRAWEKESGTKIFICGLTADVSKGGAQSSLKAGMNELLSKPVDHIQLRDVLQKQFIRNVKKVVVKNPKQASGRFDKEMLLDNLGNNHDDYRKMLHTVIADNTRKMKELREAMEVEDLNTVKELAHFVRGSSLSLGFNDLAAITIKVEESADNGRIQGVENALLEMEEEWMALKKILIKEVAG